MMADIAIGARFSGIEFIYDNLEHDFRIKTIICHLCLIIVVSFSVSDYVKEVNSLIEYWRGMYSAIIITNI